MIVGPNRQQSAWMHSAFGRVQDVWRGRVYEAHQKRLAAGSWFDAQSWLEGTAEKLSAVRVPVSLSDGEICDLADRRARECMGLPGVTGGNMAEMRRRMGVFCQRWGVEPPGCKVGDLGAVRRMSCPQWWRRRLRVQQGRALEEGFIALGLVHRRDEIYASNATVQRRAQQKRRNAAALEAAEAINMDTGEVLRLSELVAASNANPAIRRGELMVRIAGFEAVAKGLGHAAEFVTLTTPSSFHPKKTGDKGRVLDNPKFSGATPRQAQAYLVKIWSQIRAKLARIGVRPYGFRIAEPHHDATPHWHMLLFVAAESVKAMREVIRTYALRMDGNEPGAQKNRVEFVAIDWKRGSAAGYVAKYVSKNIDGFQVQADWEGDNLDAVTGSQRVEAWASTWGIRQFQQIGGAPIGVWRELRRMREKNEEYSEKLEDARAAADAGNWRRYVEIQGGPTVERRNLALRVAYVRPGERWHGEKGVAVPANPTRYGDIAGPGVYGVRDVVRGVSHVSRFYLWEIRRNQSGKPSAKDGRTAAEQLCQFGGAFAGLAFGTGGVRTQCDAAGEGNLRQAAGGGGPGRFGQGEVTGDWSAYGRPSKLDADGFPLGCFSGSAKPAPWSPVNNCTGEGDEGVMGGVFVPDRVSQTGLFGMGARGILQTMPEKTGLKGDAYE